MSYIKPYGVSSHIDFYPPTVQYESATESATQMGVNDLPPEPFTDKQQRQTRMDGGEDEDGSRREFVPIGPPVVQPHIEREHACASAGYR